MCGICGVVDPTGVRPSLVKAMTRALGHRGPDDEGFAFLDGSKGEIVEDTDRPAPVALGFRRLAILDLSPAGHQPMLTPDRRYVLVFNGEIYNFQELRDALAARGITFRSRADSEVILRLYEAEGPAMLARLNGMFALAIYDRETGTLFLARDPLGIKPLYYRREGSRFAFASEVKAFLEDPAFTPEIDRSRLSEYLLFRHVIGPGTLLRGVSSVEPGTYLLVRAGEVSEHRYWSVPDSTPEEGAERRLEPLLAESVRMQLISDVRVGAQLSGGVDSSLVSAMAVDAHKELFDSVSVTIPDPDLSEERYIDEVNARLGMQGHKTSLDARGLLDDLEIATWHFDFPISHPNAIGIRRLAALARQHVTVLLSGEGADEVFAGYLRYQRAAWLARIAQVPGASRLVGSRLWPLASLEDNLLVLSAVSDPSTLRATVRGFDLDEALGERRALWRNLREPDPVERLLTFDMRTFMVELLTRQDKMCMAHGVENRVPFLDHRVVELSKRLPTRWKLRVPLLPRSGNATRHTKHALKKLAADRFGEEFAYRTKSGFPVPAHEMFRGATFAQRFPSYRDAIVATGAAEAQAVDRVYEAARRGDRQQAELLWTLLALGVWWRLMRARKPPRGNAA